MKLDQLFEQTLLEFGSHGFPGYGRQLFKRADHEWFARLIKDVPVQVRSDVEAFIIDMLRRDNRSFNEKTFKENQSSSYWGSRREFQQRHFYYIAGMIQDLPLQKRVWLGNFFAGQLSRTNYSFKHDVWARECGIPQEYRKYD